MRKIIIDKEELRKLYVDENMSANEISKLKGCCKKTILDIIREYGITKDKELIEFTHVNNNKKYYIDKYGVDNAMKLEEYKEKVKQTKKDKYGSETYNNREKASQTCLDKYGVDNNMKVEEIKNKVFEAQKINHGGRLAMQENINNFETYNDKEKFTKYVGNKKHTYRELADYFNVTLTHIYRKLKEYDIDFENVKHVSGTSNFEKEIYDYLVEDLHIPVDDIEKNNRTVLAPQEIDIYIPSLKIGIECNGGYWHSELQKPKNYHLNKALLAEVAGIRLIQIWDYEWDDPVKNVKLKSLLEIATGKVGRKIYARKCEIREITNDEAKVLNNKVHMQGHRIAQVTYGLYYEDELVQLMSFSNTKYNRNLKTDKEWEIIRGCPGSNNIVVGGVDKLFKHFIKEKDPDVIFSYCDFNKFNGKSYEAIGMKFIENSGPDLVYWINGKPVPRRGKGKQDYAACEYRMYGAGSKKYVWIKDGYDKTVSDFKK